MKRKGCLYTHHPLLDQRDDETAANRRTAGLVGIVVTLLLLIVGLFLVHQLRSSAAVEDCLLAGCRNCDALVTTQN